jgi:hypothetical protein
VHIVKTGPKKIDFSLTAILFYSFRFSAIFMKIGVLKRRSPQILCAILGL